MVKAFNQATLDLLDGESLVIRDLVVVTMPEGAWGFWGDVYDTQFPDYWPGVTFTGAADLISISSPNQTLTDDVQSVTGSLSGLSSTVLNSLGAYNLHRARVEVARAYYHPETRALVTVDVRFRGFINRDEVPESSGEAVLNIECISRARELDGATYRKRTNSDQKRTFPTDKGFEFTNKAITTRIEMGR